MTSIFRHLRTICLGLLCLAAVAADLPVLAGSAQVRSPRVVEPAEQRGTLQQLAARNAALATTLTSLAAEARSKGSVKVTVKLAVPFAPVQLLSARDKILQQHDLAGAVLAVKRALPAGTQMAQRADLPYIDLTLDAPTLAKLQTLPGLSRISRPEQVNWRRDFVSLRAGAGVPVARPVARSALTAVSTHGTIASARDTEPYFISLVDDSGGPDAALSFCGGALVAERFVVTTGLCAEIIWDFSAISVAVSKQRKDDFERLYKVRRVYVHPQFDWAYYLTGAWSDYDVAVMELETPITGVPLATLAERLPAAGTVVHHTGWEDYIPGSRLLQREEIVSSAVNGFCGGYPLLPRMICTDRKDQTSLFSNLGALLTVDGASGKREVRASQVFAAPTKKIARNFSIPILQSPASRPLSATRYRQVTASSASCLPSTIQRKKATNRSWTEERVPEGPHGSRLCMRRSRAGKPLFWWCVRREKATPA